MGTGKKLLDEPELLRRDRAARHGERLPGASLFDALGPGGAAGALGGQIELFHDNVGSGHHVAETPPLGIEVHHQSAQDVTRRRQHVGGAHQIAQRRLAQSDRQA